MLTDNDLHLITERLCQPNFIPISKELDKKLGTVWIASGLAKISAFYGSFLMEKYAQRFSRFSTPLSYVQLPTPQCTPILISLRGKHPDSISVINHFLDKNRVDAIFLTADAMGGVASIMKDNKRANNIICTELPSRDKRTVNFNSIFILNSLIHHFVASSLDRRESLNIDVKKIKKIFEKSQTIASDLVSEILNIKDWSTKQFIILSNGIPSEIGITWQSIMSEAGLFTPVCSDLKDYTHGDHSAAVRTRENIYIVISNPKTRLISDIFCERFSLLFPVLYVNLDDSGVYGFWQNLFLAMNCASLLTASLGYTNQRLPKHPTVHNWRGWGDI